MISIIIPTYNRVESLKSCVESIIPQYFEGIELIIVDDGSTDATAEYLNKLRLFYSFVKIITNQKNSGVNFSRNEGIRKASKEYILFIDSDDKFRPGSLAFIRDQIAENKNTKHFLFIVSDRASEFEYLKANKQVQYEEWINRKVYGDFTHVVSTEILKKHLFHEQYRMFETLNWLRVKKVTSPQLLVNFITTERDRQREDSLTTSSQLKTIDAIESKFSSSKMYYSMYFEDLKKFYPQALRISLIKIIVLGVACNQKNESKDLIKYADKNYIKILGRLALFMPPVFIKQSIIRYSKMKY